MKRICLLLLCLLMCTGCALVEPVAEPVEAVSSLPPVSVEYTMPPTEEEIVRILVEATATPSPEPTFTPSPEPTPEPTQEPTPTPEPTFDLFAGKLLPEGAEPILTENSYQSDQVAIFVEERSYEKKLYGDPVVIFLADIYLKDITLLKSGFTRPDFRYKYTEDMGKLVEEFGAVLALSGDFIRHRDAGICLRNGELYRKTHDPKRDVCVITTEGVMETYLTQEVDVNALLAREDLWHIIGFGPQLLTPDGQVKTEFNSQVKGRNPRAVIGYYEPGHYAFLFVEGRTKRSEGIAMEPLSQLCFDLGFAQAFNLDGGETAGMFFNGKVLRTEGDHTRDVHDIFYIMP